MRIQDDVQRSERKQEIYFFEAATTWCSSAKKIYDNNTRERGRGRAEDTILRVSEQGSGLQLWQKNPKTHMFPTIVSSFHNYNIE